MSRPVTETAERMARRGILGVGLSFVLGTIYLCGHLVDLQIVRGFGRGAGLRTGERRQTLIAAPRATIYDRTGKPMASDRPVMDLRAELTLRAWPTLADYRKSEPSMAAADLPPRRISHFDRAIEQFVDDVGAAIRDVPEFQEPEPRGRFRDRLTAALGVGLKRIAADAVGTEDLDDPDLADHEFGESVKVDVLLAAGVDDPELIEALTELDGWMRLRRGDVKRGRLYRGLIHQVTGYRREVLDRELLVSVLGRFDGVKATHGLEAIAHEPEREGEKGEPFLAPNAPGWRTERRTAGGMPVLLVPDRDPAAPTELYTSLDVHWMRVAHEHLMATVDRIDEHYGGPPEWGGVVLVHVETGEIVAASSYTANTDGEPDPFGAYTPMQRGFPPGSVVKPLLVAIGLEQRAFAIDEIIDCADGRFASGRSSRIVPDDHSYGDLTVAGVLIKSSNRGAARLGVRMGRQGLDFYIDRYGFGRPSGILWEGEFIGHGPRWKSHHDDPGQPARFAQMNDVDFGVWYGPSVSYGYEMKATILQIARAYLSLIDGRERELRITRGIFENGRAYPRERFAGRRFLSAEIRAQVIDALSLVVTEGTARNAKRHLAGEVRDFEFGDLAGKTGTSQFDGRNVLRWDGTRVDAKVRTSTFAGFAPAHDPEYLAVCVFQKVGASNFYGGTYAAPVAMGLLLDVRAGVGTGGSGRSGSGASEAIRSAPRAGATRGR